jgi:hypothetical protein
MSTLSKIQAESMHAMPIDNESFSICQMLKSLVSRIVQAVATWITQICSYFMGHADHIEPAKVPLSESDGKIDESKQEIYRGPTNRVFCPPPLGKPDSNHPIDLQNRVPRARVRQGPQKGETCFYYALNMIRNRIGKNSPSCQMENREFEKIFSGWRKDCSVTFQAFCFPEKGCQQLNKI